MISTLILLLHVTLAQKTVIHDQEVGLAPVFVKSPDGRYTVRAYQGEASIQFLDLTRTGSKKVLKSFMDFNSFAWVGGRRHCLLVGTGLIYGDGDVFEWEGGSKTLFKPSESQTTLGSYELMEVWLSRVDSLTGRVKLRLDYCDISKLYDGNTKNAHRTRYRTANL